MPGRNDHEVRIPLPPAFDFEWALGFLAARTVPALDSVSDGSYRRAVRLRGKPVTLALAAARLGGDATGQHGERCLIATARPALTPATLSAAVRQMLDLDT